MASIHKLILYLIVLAVILNTVIALDNVMILSFDYDNGNIIFVQKTLKPGYFPDNKLAPAQGYRLIEISDNDEVLYSTNFEVPRIIFTDATTDYGEVKGNMIVLNKTSFALIVPYFESIKSIRIIDEQQKEVTSIPMAPKLSPKNPLFVTILLFIIGIICIIFALTHLKMHKKKK